MEEKRVVSSTALGALVGLLLAACLVLAETSSAESTGGMALVGGSATTAPSQDTRVAATGVLPSGGVRFGSRILRLGMVGEDVRVLNAIVKSHKLVKKVRVTPVFHAKTSAAVRRFQATNALPPTGVVDRRTAKALAGSMKRANTTWYGPGFYGSQTACGQILGYETIGVAHRNLPCGTKVTFRYRGRSLVVPVIDRGPFVRGIMWDLTGAAARILGFSGSGPIRYAIAR
jgi:rare lipoprotein A (peptidoglycan hydrolase)